MEGRAILRFGARIFLIRRKIVYEALLSELHPATARISVHLRPGTSDDLTKMSEEEHHYGAPAKSFAQQRLRAGDMFTVCDVGGHVVSYGWLMFGQMDMGVARYLPLADDTGYLYRLFTTKPARGKGLSNVYFWYVAQQLAARNMRRVVSWIEARNHLSCRVHEKAGFRRIGTIWHIQFLFRTYFFASSDIRRKVSTPGLSAEPASVPTKVAHGA